MTDIDALVERLRAILKSIGFPWQGTRQEGICAAIAEAADALIAMQRDKEVAARDRDELTATLDRNGYRRCDIPACNCGGWHGGHASERLREISDALSEADLYPNGNTILQAVNAAINRAERAEAELAAGRDLFALTQGPLVARAERAEALLREIAAEYVLSSAWQQRVDALPLSAPRTTSDILANPELGVAAPREHGKWDNVPHRDGGTTTDMRRSADVLRAQVDEDMKMFAAAPPPAGRDAEDARRYRAWRPSHAALPDAMGYCCPSCGRPYGDEEQRQALRYRWLRSIDSEQMNVMAHYAGTALDGAIDAAMLAAQSAEEGQP